MSQRFKPGGVLENVSFDCSQKFVALAKFNLQSIIHGKLPAANAHERFRYDFTEKLVANSAE